MRIGFAVVLFLAAAQSAAYAQCPIGSFPKTNSYGEQVCQSAAGQTPTIGSVVSCPPGTETGVDSYGNRTCVSAGASSRNIAPTAPYGAPNSAARCLDGTMCQRY
jgi:hypothetical protein